MRHYEVVDKAQLRKTEKAKKYIEEALDSLNMIRMESMKLKLEEAQERVIKEFDFGVN